MSGDASMGVTRRPTRRGLWRRWSQPCVIVAWAGAADEQLRIPVALGFDGLVRGPYRRLDHAALQQRSSGAMALTDATRYLITLLRGSLPPPMGRGLVVGSATGSLNEVVHFLDSIDRVGATLVNPGLFPFTVPNAAAGLDAIACQCEGPNLTFCNGATSVFEALHAAVDLVTMGNATMVFAGGFEAIGNEAGRVLACDSELERAIVAGVVAVTTAAAARAASYTPHVQILSYATGGDELLGSGLKTFARELLGQLGDHVARTWVAEALLFERYELAPLELLRAVRIAAEGQPVVFVARDPHTSAVAGFLLGPAEEIAPTS